MSSAATYTAFWLYKASPRWREQSSEQQERGRKEFVDVLEARGARVQLRGAYSTAGLRPDVDMILWVIADNLDPVQELAVALNRTALGSVLEMKYGYIGLATASQYDPTHGPAFLRGIPPKQYLSVYPFTKTPEWYVLPFEKRRELMAVHGELGDEFPSILTNTVSSFGIQDQEFIVALEDDDPEVLVRMVQRLRAAEVRIYTKEDTPIFLGRLKDLDDVLRDLG